MKVNIELVNLDTGQRKRGWYLSWGQPGKKSALFRPDEGNSSWEAGKGERAVRGSVLSVSEKEKGE